MAADGEREGGGEGRGEEEERRVGEGGGVEDVAWLEQCEEKKKRTLPGASVVQ